MGYLVETDKKSQTIKSYISAIKSILRDDGIMLNEDKYLLTSLTKACKYRNDRVRTRLPIGKPLLEIILRSTKEYFYDQGQIYLCNLYRALFSSAYYGLLRVGEMTSGDHPIRVIDVQIGENKNKILFILRTLKTHWRDVKPQTVKITSTNFKRPGSCPFEIIREFVRVRRCYLSADEPFFIFKDISLVKPRNMRDTLKLILKRENFKDENYNVHSFRIG